MMPFEYQRAQTAQQAATVVSERPGAVFLGGGTNLVDHMKLGVASPDLLVDVTRLPLKDVETLPDGGLRIGAGVRNSDLAADPTVRRRYPALSLALLAGASGQLRNLATTAGNLLQRTRCVYFQDVTTPCNKREPGTGCSALGGYVRYHAILGASKSCVAVHPSDMAVAMAMYDAEVVVLDADGPIRIPIADLHRLPGDQPERDTVLEHGQLITSVEIPARSDGAVSTYRKVRDRASYAFALVSVAAELVLTDGAIAAAHIAFGGVAHKPWRARRAEAILLGETPSEEVFIRAGQEELRDAEPLPGNEFKVELVQRTLVATLRTLIEGARR
jgi:xanthine dehydrogenase YagS FAD-binding subunit